MLTNEDLTRLSSMLATKEDIESIKQQTENLRDEAVSDLIRTIEDGLSEAETGWTMKEATITARLDEQERWIRKIAERFDIDLAF